MTSEIGGQKKEALKVLVAVPTMGIESDPNRWLKSYLNVLNGIRQCNITHAPLFPYKTTWFKAMNYIFDIAFTHEFDYILRMDDDVWGIGLDYFKRLLDADKDVIGALYATRYFPYVYAALRKIKDIDILEGYNDRLSNLEEITESTGIHKVDLIGFGMTLIKVAPFRHIKRPLFPEVEGAPDDTYFAKICQDAKIEQYVHMDLKMAHREITPMNRKYLMNADARMMLQNGMVKADGSDFSNKLITNFGEDGMLDLGQLKGL